MHCLVDVFGSSGHRVLTFGTELKSGVFGAIDPVVAEVDLRTGMPGQYITVAVVDFPGLDRESLYRCRTICVIEGGIDHQPIGGTISVKLPLVTSISALGPCRSTK